MFWERRVFVLFRFFFFERTRPAASMKLPCLIYLPASTGVRTERHFFIGVYVYVCVTFVIFTDCERCTKPISTNPGYMEAGEYGLMRETFRRTPPRGGRGRRAAVDLSLIHI